MEITVKVDPTELGQLVRLVASVLSNGPRSEPDNPAPPSPSKARGG